MERIIYVVRIIIRDAGGTTIPICNNARVAPTAVIAYALGISG